MQPVQHYASVRLRMWAWIFFTGLWSCGLGFQCLDNNNNPIDWYSVYKTPEIPKSDDPNIRTGFGHFYLDVNSPEWTLSTRSINESQQAVYETLTAVYENTDDDTMYLMYNDQGPPEVSNYLENGDGHTKGVVAFNKTSGFWLIHSVPHFPPIKSKSYSWPHTALKFGQTFLCVTFPYKELGNICTQLQYNQPNIYDSNVPQSFIADFPCLGDIINGKTSPGPPWSSVLEVTSLNGQAFTSFAKSGEFRADLYDNLVAPTLKQDLLVETWLNGEGGKLDSNCTAVYKVMKITNVTLPAQEVSFSETKDHAKWAISFSSDFRKEKALKRSFKMKRDHAKLALRFSSELKKEKVQEFDDQGKWTCVGDINRMDSQFKRGGGTLCLENYSMWETFRNSVAGYDKC